MQLTLLRSIARSLMRTANRRIQSYRKKGIQNPDIEGILENIENRPYYDHNKDRLVMKGLSERDLSELIEVQRELRKTETVREYSKTVKDIYKSSGIHPETDINMFYRAIKRFESAHGAFYREWTDTIVKTGIIDSKGDTLAQWFKEILDEQIKKEYTRQEAESIFSEDGFSQF